MSEERGKFRIVGRYLDGVKVVGYHVLDENDIARKLDKETVDQMAIEKMFSNCTAQRYKGEIVIKGLNCRLSDLPSVDVVKGKIREEELARKRVELMKKMSIVGRILDGKNVIGYVLCDYNNNMHKVSKEKVIEMAVKNDITNARVQKDRGTLILRGSSTDLSKLPSYRARN